MDNYIWLLDKKNDATLAWPFTLSLLLHFLLFTIMVIRPVYPLTGDTYRLDSVWLYFNLQPAGTPRPPSPTARQTPAHKAIDKGDVPGTVQDHMLKESREGAVPPAPTRYGEDIAERQRSETESPGETDSEPVAELVEAKMDGKKPGMRKDGTTEQSGTPSSGKPEIDMDEPVSITEPWENRETMSSPLPSRNKPEPVPQGNGSRGAVEAKGAENRLLNTSTAVKEIKPVQAKTEIKLDHPDTTPMERKAAIDRAPVPDKKESPAIREYTPIRPVTTLVAPTVKRDETRGAKQPSAGAGLVESGGYAARGQSVRNPSREKVSSGAAVATIAEEKKTIGAVAKPDPIPSAKKTGDKSDRKAVTVLRRTETKVVKITEKAKPAGKKQSKGSDGGVAIAIPPLIGDLKLQIKGCAELKVTFSFREYLKSRRNRAMSRTEAMRFDHVVPLVSRPRDNFLEAVVGTTGEGIYDIAVEPMDGKPATCAFVVKIFENSGRSRTRPLGTKVLKEKAVVARILMPEGIFWDDDAYFSGNLEDSDSITKYNSETGITWKEFK